ncbi:hypothetical protein GPJ56_003694 [Histomonas meleagridis]|uniref:uncharacterized protein n=1 Tax=Histomonas meleagridis TaxID=135588 RepID=UPI00355A890A|nr:hypothetical protein GPJ56_003694 [Histomonas meleagridis]KAH0806221.1 hypothetical protein GO595_000909 [Histomonas meleagridis]
MINFTVFIFKAGKKKIFGKFEVDVSQFYNVSTPTTINIPIQTPHSGRNEASITFSSTTNQTAFAGSGTNTDDNLTSMSEAIQLTTDIQDDWDVSDIVSQNDKEKINKFFQQRHDEREERRNNLAQFAKANPSRLSSRNKLKHASVGVSHHDHVASSGSLSAFLTQKSKASPNPISLPNKPTPEKVNPLPHALDLIKSILSRMWDESPLNFLSTPKSVSAVISVFTHLNVFEPNTFTDEEYFQIITEFNAIYKESNLIKDGTFLERFIISLNILSCIQTDLRFDQDRVKSFVSFFSPIVSGNFDLYINSLSPQFQDIRSCIINLTFTDVKFLIENYNKKIQKITKQIYLLPKIIELIQQQINNVIDSKLVEQLIETPNKCTFSNAIQWNSFITILDGDYSIYLPLFREAVSVLMMSTSLCASPEIKADIIKLLTPLTVLKILEIQKPDELMPVENNVSDFCEYFGLSHDMEFKPINVNYENGFDDEILKCLPNEWIQNTFPKEILDEFPFMNMFFA